MHSGPIPFAEFYRDVHGGQEPFAWQSALAKTVLASGWPDAISMPTASGKTSVLDIAVWHLACEISAGQIGRSKRTAPLRIALIVDRRVSVDDSYRRAVRLAGALRDGRGGSGAAARAAEALCRVSSGEPLRVKRLRGGIPQDSRWDASPSDPTIVLSTVDQIGSRLLLRGYGVRRGMLPVHAGLVGTDTLYILDEAHLSEPFIRTLRRVGDMRKSYGWEAQGPVVRMSATLPPGGQDRVFPPPDQKQAMIDDMGERMSRPKPAALLAAGKNKAPATLARIAEKIMAGDGPRRIGIVVNTVGAARDVFEGIRTSAKKRGYEAHLLTGRSRPLDREALTRCIVEGLRPGSSRMQRSMTVSTQCIEAGADITFDALLTQAAPLDSLLQRFGRLNRIGDGEVGKAAIVADGRDIGNNGDDPVYGRATAETWSWLMDVSNGSNVVDFGAGSFRMPDGNKIGGMSAPKRGSATLLPAYIKAWHATMHPGSPDPDISLFLHGIPDKRQHQADVSVVWRAAKDLDGVELSVRTMPPSALEAIQLPVWHVRRWLEGVHRGGNVNRGIKGVAAAARDLADVEDQYVADSKKGNKSEAVVRVGARGKCEQVEGKNIRPGDTVVVPSSYGGCDRYGWTGMAGGDPVADISMASHLIQRGRLALRTDGEASGDAAGGDAWEALQGVVDGEDGDAGVVHAVSRSEGLPESWRNAARGDTKAEVIRKDDGTVFGVSFGRTLSPEACRSAIKPVSEDMVGMVAEYAAGRPSSGSGGGVVPLDEHLRGVAAKATEFARKSGLDDLDVSSIETAARLHDIGKTEPIMQAVLHGTTREGTAGLTMIAKSGRRNRKERDAAKRLAGMPGGYRHEWFSASKARDDKAVGGTDEADLVMWLIGTHHGYGRPIFPANTWGEGIDPWWCGLAERVYRRYGPWKLAHMEAVLRLADMHRSRDEDARVVKNDGAGGPAPGRGKRT